MLEIDSLCLQKYAQVIGAFVMHYDEKEDGRDISGKLGRVHFVLKLFAANRFNFQVSFGLVQ